MLRNRRELSNFLLQWKLQHVTLLRPVYIADPIRLITLYSCRKAMSQGFGSNFLLCFHVLFVHDRVISGHEVMHALFCVIRHCFPWWSHTFWFLFKRIAVLRKCLRAIHVHNGGMNFLERRSEIGMESRYAVSTYFHPEAWLSLL